MTRSKPSSAQGGQGPDADAGPQGPRAPADDGQIVLRDAHSIRALAHPARMAVIEAMAGGPGMTATECAGIVGLSPSAMSYHLRALEKWGIVERVATASDARERPWRLKGRGIKIDTSVPAAIQVVESALVDVMFAADRRAVSDFLGRRDEEPSQWRDMTLGHCLLWLTAEEFAVIQADLTAVVDRFRDRGDPARRPTGARQVRITNLVVPAGPP